MKKKRTLLLASLVLMSFSLVACGTDKTSEAKPDTPTSENKNTAAPATDKAPVQTATLSLVSNVETVELKVDQSATITNYYTVKKSSGSPTAADKACTYVVEDPTVVKIINKTIKGLKVGSTKLTVTSSKDKTKTCQFMVNVTEVYFDRQYSQISSEDDFTKELPADGGIVRTKGSATADLFVKGISSTEFVADCTFALNSVASSEKFPKLGIVCSTADQAAEDTTTNNKMYFFLNPEMPNGEDKWDRFGICEVQNNSNWAWNPNVTNETARHRDDLYVASTPITYATEFKLTMVRKNLEFHFFVNDNYAGSCKSYESLFKNGTTDLPTMVGFFEFNSDVTFSKYNVETDSEKVASKISSISDVHFLTDSEWAAD